MDVLRSGSATFRAARYSFCSSPTYRIVTEFQALVLLYFYFPFVTLMLVVKRTSIRCRQDFIVVFAVYS